MTYWSIVRFENNDELVCGLQLVNMQPRSISHLPYSVTISCQWLISAHIRTGCSQASHNQCLSYCSSSTTVQAPSISALAALHQSQWISSGPINFEESWIRLDGLCQLVFWYHTEGRLQRQLLTHLTLGQVYRSCSTLQAVKFLNWTASSSEAERNWSIVWLRVEQAQMRFEVRNTRQYCLYLSDYQTY